MKIFVLFALKKKTRKLTFKDLEPSDSIQIVKTMIEAEDGIPPPEQVLYSSLVHRTILGDDKTLADYNITDGDYLFCLVKRLRSEDAAEE